MIFLLFKLILYCKIFELLSCFVTIKSGKSNPISWEKTVSNENFEEGTPFYMDKKEKLPFSYKALLDKNNRQEICEILGHEKFYSKQIIKFNEKNYSRFLDPIRRDCCKL